MAKKDFKEAGKKSAKDICTFSNFVSASVARNGYIEEISFCDGKKQVTAKCSDLTGDVFERKLSKAGISHNKASFCEWFIINTEKYIEKNGEYTYKNPSIDCVSPDTLGLPSADFWNRVNNADGSRIQKMVDTDLHYFIDNYIPFKTHTKFDGRKEPHFVSFTFSYALKGVVDVLYRDGKKEWTNRHKMTYKEFDDKVPNTNQYSWFMDIASGKTCFLNVKEHFYVGESDDGTFVVADTKNPDRKFMPLRPLFNSLENIRALGCSHLKDFEPLKSEDERARIIKQRMADAPDNMDMKLDPQAQNLLNL